MDYKGCKESDMTEQLSLYFTKDFILTFCLCQDLSPNKVTGDLRARTPEYLLWREGQIYIHNKVKP